MTIIEYPIRAYTTAKPQTTRQLDRNNHPFRNGYKSTYNFML